MEESELKCEYVSKYVEAAKILGELGKANEKPQPPLPTRDNGPA